jgi:type IV pilus assembly protein PilC
MKFLYTAKTEKGEVQTGVIEAGSREGALKTLQGFGLVVLQLREEKERPFYENIFGGLRRVGIRDVAIFTRQLATLLQAEVSLVDALRTMFRQTRNPYLKEAVFDVLSDVEAGASLSQAFSRHEVIFSQFFVAMVRSAEITGRLQEVFAYLADYLETQSALSSKIRGAMIYPAFVLALFLLVIAVMVLVVIPQLKLIFVESGLEFSRLPIVTRILFGLGDFVRKYGLAVVLSVLAGVFAIRSYFKSEEGKMLFDLAVLRLPYFGDIARKIYLARFAETTSVMIKGDIPVAQALEIAGDVVGNTQYRYLIFEAVEAVRRGELISQALERSEREFPALVTQMIAIGEKTGRLDELTHRVSEFYSREVERILANATELIQPILIVVLGIFVGLLIGAIILPIYQLAQTF